VNAALKVLLRATLVCAALAASFVHVQPAAAATPCWKTLLNDWYDGRIDQTYPKHCYTDALNHLPADVSTYSSAHDDILRALQSAVARERKTGHKVNANTLIPAQKTKPGKGGGPGTTTTSTTTKKKDDGGGLTKIANELNPGSATSLPLPLLILGALALLLVAAGGAGLLAKRIQARRPPPA